MKDLLRTLTHIDLDILDRCAVILRPFKDVTVFMSSETSTTASLILPLLQQLTANAKPDVDAGDPPVIHNAKAALYHNLETR